MSHQEEPQDPESKNLVGYAAVKYTAIVVIVIVVLLFLVWLINKIF